MLDLKIDDQPEVFDIELDPGRKIDRHARRARSTSRRPACRPTGCLGASTRDGKGVGIDLVAGSFSVEGLDPEREAPRTILFVQKDRGLIGRAALRGDEPGPVQVRLDRWASATGRLVGKDGKPRREATLRHRASSFPSPQLLTDAKGHSAPDSEGKPWPHPVQTDNEGRFRIDGLAPDMAYELVLVTPVKKEVFMVGEARTVETRRLVDRWRPDQRAEPRARRDPGARDRSRGRPAMIGHDTSAHEPLPGACCRTGWDRYVPGPDASLEPGASCSSAPSRRLRGDLVRAPTRSPRAGRTGASTGCCRGRPVPRGCRRTSHRR